MNGSFPFGALRTSPCKSDVIYIIYYLGQSVGSGSHSEDDFQLVDKRGLDTVSELLRLYGGHLPNRNMEL